MGGWICPVLYGFPFCHLGTSGPLGHDSWAYAVMSGTRILAVDHLIAVGCGVWPLWLDMFAQFHWCSTDWDIGSVEAGMADMCSLPAGSLPDVFM